MKLFRIIFKIIKFIGGALAIIAVIYGVFFLYETKFKSHKSVPEEEDPEGTKK